MPHLVLNSTSSLNAVYSCTYVELDLKTYVRERQTANLTQTHWSRDFLTFAARGKCRKTAILISLIINMKKKMATGNG